MDVKKDILWRVYLCLIGMALFGVAILVKVFYIQQVKGNYWRSMADSLHTSYVALDAERGTIFSEEGRMLSTSIPYFDIRIDFAADGLRDKKGKVFEENLDSLSLCLANTFNDRTKNEYKTLLREGYKSKDRYFLLKRDVPFNQYQALRSFPMFRLGKNKGGMIAEPKSKRINPFKLLANRTIGLARENSQSVGLERTYNEYLKGVTGKRLMRRIAGGTYVPVDGYDIEPENGRDIVTTLDVNMQDIVESALYKMMVANEAEHGTCILMEVKTGKIKAIANLGRQPDGSYWEDMNYALQVGEPGSTFKLATVITVLEDKYATMNTMVNMENGRWQVGRRTVFDSEPHPGPQLVTIKHAFELSSNVGMAKLAYQYYGRQPNNFVNHLKKLRLDQSTGIDLVGEGKPVIKTTASKTWSNTTLPWMAFGYEVLVSPLQTCMLYNAVANNGKMMKPYLVNSIQEFGQVVKKFEPTVLIDSICSQSTLKQVQAMLEGVMIDGTGKKLRTPYYSIAAKTGTALVANGNRGYADKIYQSSFAGYFPAKDPQYTCVVVIKNKPHALRFYGASIAGPVFREVADKLYAMAVEKQKPMQATLQLDTLLALKNGRSNEWKEILTTLRLPVGATPANNSWVSAKVADKKINLNTVAQEKGAVPDVTGMGLKDALYLLENAGLRVVIKGAGKVKTQSLPGGTKIGNEQTIVIELS
ncbi:cell division protein FtsI (penicillin-binding protein 3) [Chitinophaga terrae (ex Kim and Jung 2007)]|uniref:Cell division protein FtsI (Penicillin-binding protein 3) n=1 Tax=Chitinophaga terrae (ex Kim and Jung 2007) TaxID=408074 RepID=A0A1H4DL55_9BACT|nr:penicillin-binding protein [Chitinophaga terrae (ex Kim and Jung 2007)]MDQ0107807.1 cell division protein FtsI (penicillin-binding protein 3) [Chitinophaga terrae (ex Kim and Jung 2007)]GEP90981.1 penicillin-binding protein [Chitinophaga terrae (ex Kim and Jung 2007)]SEA73553.1 cell division protein FtsI (penicillin-binding protein 3) [Chitinophaga terrae (ex Kim and Jung 2007)]